MSEPIRFKELFVHQKPTGLNWHPTSEPVPERLDNVALLLDRKTEQVTHWVEITGPVEPSPEAEKLKRLREAARKFVEASNGHFIKTTNDEYLQARAALEKELNQ